MSAPARPLVRAALLALALAAHAPAALAQAQRTANPHGALPRGLDCSACHTPEAWTPTREPMRFEHGGEGGFRLTGAHQQASCAGCHEKLRFDGPEVAPTDCVACHQDPHEGTLVADCAQCHVTSSFRAVDGQRVHARTAFPLTGAHQQLTCVSCHTDERGGAFTARPTDCVACHRADYEGARTVDHVAASYPTDCTTCHATTGWQDAPLFDHVAVSRGFELAGAHRTVACAGCHVTPGMAPRFQAAGPGDCVACHRADYDREHRSSRFSTECTQCHTVQTWEDPKFDHALTGFALVGLHGKLGCASCHGADRALEFAKPASTQDCVACHRTDYDRKHASSGYPTTCLTCHQTESWGGARFDHAATRFPLVGAHTAVTCASCHGGPGGALLARPSSPQDCVACHRADYDRKHAGSAFPTTCTTCHTPSQWTPATADHVTLSRGFALVGPHASAACTTCHQVPGYALRFPKPAGQQDCVACHRADYDRKHAGSGYSTSCLTCHQADRWSGATADHVTLSRGFALVGPHASAACTTCHQVPGYALLFPKPAGQQDCVACHRADYDRKHAGSGFSTNCLTCHQADRWTGATIDHPTVARGFRLLGAHATLACASCHAQPGNALLFPRPASDQDCVTCHRPDYDGAHAGSGFPTTCTTCHTPQSWASTFNHDAQYFRIYSGAHRGKWASCATCHTVPSNFASFTCLTCHLKPQADEKHKEVRNYAYDSARCYACHGR